MDNVGDWLNIVLMVAAGIIAILNSGKKKKRTSTAPDTTQQKPDIDIDNDEEETEDDDKEETSSDKGFWEILEEIAEKKKTKSTQPEAPATKPGAASPEPAYTFNDELATSITPTQPAKTAAPTTEEPGIKPETTFTDIQEIRKAIIYAEILHRKY